MNKVQGMLFCKWSFDVDDGFYTTSCGHTFFFVDEPCATENQFKVCPYCGKRIDDDYQEAIEAQDY